MFNLNSFFLPKFCRLIDLETKERVLAERHIKLIWHFIFDECPSLQSKFSFFFEEFLEWSYVNWVDLDWSFVLQYLKWLAYEKLTVEFDKQIISEVMLAALNAWGKSNKSEMCCCKLICRLLPNKIFVVRKGNEWNEPRRVFILELNMPFTFKTFDFAYFSEEESLNFNVPFKWKEI
ncbi:MAG: hypothetical protein BGO14_07860 [Chlamydiales bacterium 38-26]|nr:hypothetical protein [Chlamydiales bacterium]OJV10912.1 MAG: hypothetical protein BGO14_07860 [Chlamydiales bacterium 38-26]